MFYVGEKYLMRLEIHMHKYKLRFYSKCGRYQFFHRVAADTIESIPCNAVSLSFL